MNIELLFLILPFLFLNGPHKEELVFANSYEFVAFAVKLAHLDLLFMLSQSCETLSGKERFWALVVVQIRKFILGGVVAEALAYLPFL